MNAMLKVYLNVLNAITNEEGQGMAEYGLILALVAVVVIVALTALGGGLGDIFDGVTAELVVP
ncbi:MAG: Flp family type IVb pilin [Caldilineaceae bacterium]|nr:Flp family type IVb pilin [Caldilineaceae bacterium]MBP8107366.1 Flp family type IVb pilin [Caldilineaceae bacterium]MBP8124283.1 Flp family type IVb pilin [Caldilineaceae bacterium]MBP9074269.1 Flp family type IVb pilin [Caldilineaceae bacterium]